MKFEVNISYLGSNTYFVEAESAEKAIDAAKNRYFAGDNGDQTGAESEDIHSVTVNPTPTEGE